MLNKVGHVGVWPKLVCPQWAGPDAFRAIPQVQVAVQPHLVGVLPAGRDSVGMITGLLTKQKNVRHVHNSYLTELVV